MRAVAFGLRKEWVVVSPGYRLAPRVATVIRVLDRTIDRSERLASAAISRVAIGYSTGTYRWNLALAEIAHLMVRYRIPADRRQLVLRHALHRYADSDSRHERRVADLLTAIGADIEISQWMQDQHSVAQGQPS
jgi:hypothetical protein